MADEYRLSYTGQQVDEAIGKALAGLPTITIALSQVISQSPVQVQLTNEQYQILANNKLVAVDASALGFVTSVGIFNGSYTEEEVNYLDFVFSYHNSDRVIHFSKIIVNTSTKVANLVSAIPAEADQSATALTAYSVDYFQIAPSSANTDTANLQIVVLSSEPATRYAGYLYIITGSN